MDGWDSWFLGAFDARVGSTDGQQLIRIGPESRPSLASSTEAISRFDLFEKLKQSSWQ